MAPTGKTLEQYQKEEAQSIAAEEQRKRDEAARQNQGMFMNMFSWLWDNIGIFIFLALVWVAAKMNPEYVDRLIEALPEGWQANAVGLLNMIGIDANMKKALENMPLDQFNSSILVEKMGLEKVTAQQLIKTNDDKKALIQFIADANAERKPDGTIKAPGKVNSDTMASDKTVYALLTSQKYAPLVQEVAKAAMKPGADGKLTDKAEPILNALRTIAKDEKRLTELFTTHLDATLSLIRIAAPKASENEIQTLLAVGIQDGKASKTLSDVFTALLTPGSDGQLPEPKSVIMALASKDPKLAETVIDGFVASRPLAEAEAIKALRAKIGDGKIQQLMDAVNGSNKVQDVLRIVLHPNNIHALPQFVAVANYMPEVTSQVPFKLQNLQKFIQTTGFSVDGKPNAALVSLLNTVSTTGLDFSKLKAPLQAYMLAPEVVDNKNSLPALQTFINTIDTTRLAEADRKALETLKTQVNSLSQARLKAASVLETSGVDTNALRTRMADASGNLTASSVVSALMVPDFRETLRKANIDTLLTAAGTEGTFASPQNTKALLNFIDAIEKSPRYTGAAIDGTHKVILAFTGLVDGKTPKDAFANITPKQLAGFFNNPDNHNALLKLLYRDPQNDRSKDTLDTSKLDTKAQNLLRVLWKRLGNFNGGGFTNWLRTEEGAADFLKIITSSRAEIEKDFANKASSWEGFYAKFIASDDEAMKTYLEKLSPSTKQNASAIIEIKQSIESYLPPPSPTPTHHQRFRNAPAQQPAQ